MKPRLTSASTTLAGPSANHDGMAALAHPLTVADRTRQPHPVRPRPQLTLANMPSWNHKLILTGRLDSRTVTELEEEIECLCEEGVSALTLDLRQLDAIDSVGARGIASGGAACKQRGRNFAVVPGSPVIHRALSEVGAEDLLAGDSAEKRAVPLAAGALDAAPRDTWTVMVKSL